MDHLKSKNIANETIIIFMSDNGGLSAVARGGEKHTHNKPLSSGKGSIHEGGIREPMIAKWPGKIPAGSVNNNYLIIEDFYPTILELAGVQKYDVPQTIDGISFKDELLNPSQTPTQRALYWHYPNEWGPSGPGIGAFSAVRKGDYKLIYYHVNESFELFNIGEDIGERNNLAPGNPDMVSDLASILSTHLKGASAQMPRHKESGNQVRWPDEKMKGQPD